uniref:Uncharacterized protein n=1 Tax=viral metagenome TaxID=1070528 RepID=A0A6C0LXL9_9ZZZZ
MLEKQIMSLGIDDKDEELDELVSQYTAEFIAKNNSMMDKNGEMRCDVPLDSKKKLMSSFVDGMKQIVTKYKLCKSEHKELDEMLETQMTSLGIYDKDEELDELASQYTAEFIAKNNSMMDKNGEMRCDVPLDSKKKLMSSFVDGMKQIVTKYKSEHVSTEIEFEKRMDTVLTDDQEKMRYEVRNLTDDDLSVRIADLKQVSNDTKSVVLQLTNSLDVDGPLKQSVKEVKNEIIKFGILESDLMLQRAKILNGASGIDKLEDKLQEDVNNGETIPEASVNKLAGGYKLMEEKVEEKNETRKKLAQQRLDVMKSIKELDRKLETASPYVKSTVSELQTMLDNVSLKKSVNGPYACDIGKLWDNSEETCVDTCKSGDERVGNRCILKTRAVNLADQIKGGVQLKKTAVASYTCDTHELWDEVQKVCVKQCPSGTVQNGKNCSAVKTKHDRLTQMMASVDMAKDSDSDSDWD